MSGPFRQQDSGEVRTLLGDLASGDRRALARAITLVESTRPDHRRQAEFLLDLAGPRTGAALRIGISGPPGVGKSTIIEALGGIMIGDGKRLAVLSVDPSSSLSGGSVLGDKTRMESLARSDEAFIRPSPSGGTLGGVARRTRESLLLCEAAGYDVVIVETVGVGQSETAVAEMTDIFCLMLLPGGGDELQGVKRGIVEMADVIVVNKADGALLELAESTAASARSTTGLLRGRGREWEVPVLTCSALEGTGIPELWQTLQDLRRRMETTGGIASRRASQARAWMWAETAENLLAALREHGAVRDSVAEIEEYVTSGEVAPPTAARQLLEIFLADESPSPAPGGIGRLNHIGIAVPALGPAADLYRDVLGARVSEPEALADHGVTVVFVDVDNTRIELLEPLGDNSPLARFLKKNRQGGIHHICYETADISAAVEKVRRAGLQVLGDGRPRTGAHGKPVIFLHPKDFSGTLIELEEK